ncbi:DNA polymerase III subunit gamma/tau [Aquirufa ecclesiirivi]|uniref:DNA polymerase III subunit gamma/tau n=1 Tax=Aquirufa ecclesiirivi TaxID=2715124 RepID=A0ABT4JI08_9BACT|nr:DNA polymerase III subunit gamma/tau [Aquirufa ecclesiirivi]MCZ2475380.1 DNA polymerase III subunit gamma/tau [Aquirufa ecclesiirivi]
MENFIVSARKYRPTQFDSVVGQSHITTTLKNAIKSNHLAQAFLFCGPRGVGKTTCARILAKTINCENQSTEGEACGTCSSCQSFQENTSLTIHELDAASNNSVDDIRSLIDQVRYPPQSGRYKVYIIDEVHMLSAQAFNAFLKTLEEPPSYAIFILATTEKHKILSTILSRCQIFDFNRIKWQDMAMHLASIAEKENITAEPAALELISIKADGGLRDALSMFDLNVTFSTDNTLRHKAVLENLHILDSDYYFSLTDHLVEQNHTAVLLLIEEIMRKGFDGLQFISGLMEHLRLLLYAKDPKTLALMEMSDETKGKFKKQAELTSTSFLLSAMNICAQCEVNYKSAKNPRLHLDLSLLKINYLNSVFKPKQTPVVEDGAGKKLEASANITVENSATQELNVPVKQEVPVQEAPAPSLVIQEEKTTVPENSQSSPSPVPSRPSIQSSGLRSAKKLVETKQAEQKEATLLTGSATGAENKTFTLADISREWVRIAKAYKANQDINKFVMMNRPIELIGTVLHLKVENELQIQQFNEAIRMEVLNQLRSSLHNFDIDIELDILVQEKSDKKVLYTQSDKYEYLSEKHPILVEMKQRMGLDYEF